MAGYDGFIHSVYEGIDRDKYFLALYSFVTPTADSIELAQALVVEQTTGTWTAVPEETKEVKERSSGKVLGVYEIPDYERDQPPAGMERNIIVLVAYPVANVNGQIPELITVLYGNISMIGKLKLLDLFMPPGMLAAFPGPKFGVAGVRKILGVEKRPLLCGMFKPCIGMLPPTLEKMAYEMAAGGVEVIKDDELLADPEFCPVAARIEHAERGIAKARKETGLKSIYTVNVTDRPDRMHQKAVAAVKAGASAIMVNLYAVGYAAAQMITEDPAINVPVLGHPAFAGTLFEAPFHGLASPLVLGKFARMSGVDMIIYPSPYGKVPMLRDRAVRVATELTAPMAHLKPVFPGPAAGMHPGTVARSMADFGTDMIIGAGGGIHGHPMGVIAGGKAFHQAIEAAMNGVPAKEAALKHPELAAALAKWGDDPSSQTYSLLR
jgi:2,3-diketo-5-methylthiopentyl-1-phosphate enolase